MTNIDPQLVKTLILKQRKSLNVSYSLMNTYQECPRQAFLSMVVPRELVRDNAANVLGPSTAHDLFAAWASQAAYQPGWMRTQVEAQYAILEKKAAHVFYRKELSGKTRKEWSVNTDREYQVAKAIKAVTQLELVANVLHFKDHEIQTERWLTVKLPQQTFFSLKGAIDIFDPITRTIFDIKVTSNRSYGNPLQLYFYALLFYYATGAPPLKLAYIYPLLDKPIRYVGFDKTHINEAAKTAKAFIKAVNTGDFPVEPKSTSSCYMCSFKHYCPRFGGNYGLPEKPGWSSNLRPGPKTTEEQQVVDDLLG